MVMDKPYGILPARSKLRTKVTFSPYNHGGYKFEMICKVARVDENGFEKVREKSRPFYGSERSDEPQ